ncbi:hypothetical protein [Streptomyces sioyaensis]|uniref:hypothetical protein n=1 Tax=Streptomyces TaxID=1883 RepID=UPI0036F06434
MNQYTYPHAVTFESLDAAGALKALYDALVAVGFDDGQAFTLLRDIVKGGRNG